MTDLEREILQQDLITGMARFFLNHLLLILGQSWLKCQVLMEQGK